MLAGALNKGFNHQNMHAMRNSFMTQARQSQPQNLARSYSAAIQERQRGFRKAVATVKVPAVQGTGHQAPAVPAAARVDQGPVVAAAVVPVAVPAADPVAQAPGGPGSGSNQ